LHHPNVLAFYGIARDGSHGGVEGDCRHAWGSSSSSSSHSDETASRTSLDAEGHGVVFYLVFEWCGGGDLGTYLASPAFGVAELSRVALEVLSGVVELHANGIAQ
jgi:serine/threonine protein kinase